MKKDKKIRNIISKKDIINLKKKNKEKVDNIPKIKKEVSKKQKKKLLCRQQDKNCRKNKFSAHAGLDNHALGDII